MQDRGDGVRVEGRRLTVEPQDPKTGEAVEQHLTHDITTAIRSHSGVRGAGRVNAGEVMGWRRLSDFRAKHDACDGEVACELKGRLGCPLPVSQIVTRIEGDVVIQLKATRTNRTTTATQ